MIRMVRCFRSYLVVAVFRVVRHVHFPCCHSRRTATGDSSSHIFDRVSTIAVTGFSCFWIPGNGAWFWSLLMWHMVLRQIVFLVPVVRQWSVFSAPQQLGNTFVVFVASASRASQDTPASATPGDTLSRQTTGGRITVGKFNAWAIVSASAASHELRASSYWSDGCWGRHLGCCSGEHRMVVGVVKERVCESSWIFRAEPKTDWDSCVNTALNELPDHGAKQESDHITFSEEQVLVVAWCFLGCPFLGLGPFGVLGQICF